MRLCDQILADPAVTIWCVKFSPLFALELEFTVPGEPDSLLVETTKKHCRDSEKSPTGLASSSAAFCRTGMCNPDARLAESRNLAAVNPSIKVTWGIDLLISSRNLTTICGFSRSRATGLVLRNQSVAR